MNVNDISYGYTGLGKGLEMSRLPCMWTGSRAAVNLLHARLLLRRWGTSDGEGDGRGWKGSVKDRSTVHRGGLLGGFSAGEFEYMGKGDKGLKDGAEGIQLWNHWY